MAGGCYPAWLMAQLREIKNRMGAVKTIGRITKTMQMIATAKFTSAGQRAEKSRPYARMIDEMVRQVASDAGDYESMLIDGPPEKTGKDLMLVICSDRGLCGAYNSNVLKAASKHRQKEIGQTDVVVETAGKKATAFFSFRVLRFQEAIPQAMRLRMQMLRLWLRPISISTWPANLTRSISFQCDTKVSRGSELR